MHCYEILPPCVCQPVKQDPDHEVKATIVLLQSLKKFHLIRNQLEILDISDLVFNSLTLHVVEDCSVLHKGNIPQILRHTPAQSHINIYILLFF